jgi:D-3-phosphoglycerate dehydrogenase
MNPLKVALVAYDAPEIPQWVTNELAKVDVEFRAKQCSTQNEVLKTAAGAEFIWVLGGPKILKPETLDKLPDCIVIMRTGSGTDNIPVAKATELGIIVANTPSATADPVAEHAIALFMNLTRKIAVQGYNVRNGIFDFRAIEPPKRIDGQKMGFVGFGHIPRCMVEKLAGFKLEFLAYDPFVDEAVFNHYGVQSVSLETVFRESDTVSVHIPLKEDTFHLVNADYLSMMKSGSCLINTARGPVIDEAALMDALREGRLGGAGLDVLENTPEAGETHPIYEFNNVIVTPHMAGYAQNHLDGFWHFSIETIVDVAEGYMPKSYVNPSVKPRCQLLPNDPLGNRPAKPPRVE